MIKYSLGLYIWGFDLTMLEAMLELRVANKCLYVVVFIWPARFIWGLSLPKRKRLVLIGVFCIGCW